MRLNRARSAYDYLFTLHYKVSDQSDRQMFKEF